MSKMNKLPKVDLTLLKRLVSELEESLSFCEEIKNTENSNHGDFVIEMAKSTGLVTGIIQESSMLIGDIQSVVKASQQPDMSKNVDLIDKILGDLKGSGGSTN